MIDILIHEGSVPDINTFMNAAVQYWELGEYIPGIIISSYLRTIYPDDARGFYLAGHNLQLLGLSYNALPLLEKAEQLSAEGDDAYSDYLFSYAVSLYYTDNFKKCLDVGIRFLVREPDADYIYSILHECYVYLQESESSSAAETALLQALEQVPPHRGMLRRTIRKRVAGN